MKLVWLLAAGVGILVGVGLFDLLRVGGAFKTIEPHFEGRCRPIPGMPGAEDVAIHPDTGVALVSSYDRRAGARRGAIYALNLRDSDPVPVELTRDFTGDFRPHGISWFRDADGRESLFVVSHPETRHVVEIFDVEAGGLVHRATIEGALLRSPNDVFAVGARQFYVTNDHRDPRGFWRAVEDFLRRPVSDVVYFDGRRFEVVAENVAYPNGVIGDSSGDSVFVASTTGRAVLRYRRDRETGALSSLEQYDVATGVDNLDLGADGRIWIGAHPNMLAFLRNARDPKNLSPSQVLTLDPESGAIDEVFLSIGDDLSTSSVGAAYGNRLLIGSVFEDHLLLCEMGGAP
jgi:arylesterase/paraoxonase